MRESPPVFAAALGTSSAAEGTRSRRAVTLSSGEASMALGKGAAATGDGAAALGKLSSPYLGVPEPSPPRPGRAATYRALGAGTTASGGRPPRSGC